MVEAEGLSDDSYQDQLPPYDIYGGLFGLQPRLVPDLPVTVVFLLLFTIAYIFYSFYIARSIRRKQSYAIPALILFQTLVRISTCVMRIVWIFDDGDISLVLAFRILLGAGTIPLYCANIDYVGQVIRAGTGNHKWLRILQVMIYASTCCAVGILVTIEVLRVFTKDGTTISNCVYGIRATSTYFVALGTTPLVLLGAAYVSHRKHLFRVMRHTWIDAAIVAICSLLCMLTLGFRAGVLWEESIIESDHKEENLSWCYSGAALYTLVFAVEVLIMGLYAYVLVKQRIEHLAGEQDGRKEASRRRTTMEEQTSQATSLRVTPAATPSGSKNTSMHRERGVMNTPPVIPEICYS